MQIKEDIRQYITPLQAVLKSFLRQYVDDSKLIAFKKELQTLLTDLCPHNREETNKGCVKTFLESTFWKPEHYKVNVVNDTDLAITDKISGNVCVMFEFKKVKDTGMVKVDDLNRKSMHELVLYYILEEKKKRNTSIRHLIISDGYKYFVFGKGDFWKHFGSDTSFVNNVLKEEADPTMTRDYIYQDIISKKVEKVWQKITYTYFDLNDIAGRLGDEGFIRNRRFIALYKFFTPTHLLNLPFDKDHNTLNSAFYRELLYIMGLQEVSQGGKHIIVRMPGGNREKNSLIEQTYTLLNDYTFSSDKDQFDTALGLIMIWVNRVLFLKLLESQLVRFNGGDENYKFLTLAKIRSFETMHTLFVSVLAVPEEERESWLNKDFKDVPYLNSSLFELSEVEKKYFSISSLGVGKMNIMKGTVLRDGWGHVEIEPFSVLSYLLRFLDCYDFGSANGSSTKTIINASVLGLIFEKINGYNDGSYFTPGYITSYICRNVIRKAVVSAFNEKNERKCSNFEELKEHVDYNNPNVRREANDIINHLRICDPSVGSGHFLVSALNELIVIKRELNVLCFDNGERMRAYKVDVEDDELAVSDAEDEFHYNPRSEESKMVQKTLFEEKRTLIENCLFGVDINPKSAEICRLRLWIELLKNAYYYKDEKGVRHLQTLPNIDINIKTGNSLVMTQPLNANLRTVLAGASLSVEQYKQEVAEYKKSANKANKHRMNAVIATIKANIHKGFNLRSPLYKAWAKVYAELLTKTNDLFPDDDLTKGLDKLRKHEQALRKELDEIEDSPILSHAFEWRYEFPETLDDDGNFIGFDVIIGNPPYGVPMDNEYRTRVEKYLKHVPDYEIYYYFIELAETIIKPGGYLAYIIPNTWLFNVYAKMTRKNLLQEWEIQEVLDCTDFPIFDKATVRNALITMKRDATTADDAKAEAAEVGYRNTKGLVDERRNKDKKPFFTLINRPLLHTSGKSLMTNFSQNWALAFRLTEEENSIVEKIKSNTLTIKKVCPETSQGLIAYDKVKGQSEEIIKNQVYHSHVYKKGYKKWLLGEDVRRYFVKWNSKEYVNYCEGLANPRRPEFFKGKRLLIREITNPSIYAAITDEELYHNPSVIVVKESTNYPLELICGILNSKLGSYFHFRNSPKATKGVFPKILISDINDFPLPALNTEEKKVIAKELTLLVENISEEAKAGNMASEKVKKEEAQIDFLVCKLYGLSSEEIQLVNES